MTKSEAQEWLPMVEALASYEAIQTVNGIGNWIDTDHIDLEYGEPGMYRVKPGDNG